MDYPKTIEKFFKEHIEPKWQPTTVPVHDKKQMMNALLDTGKRFAGPGFALDDLNSEMYMNAALYILGQPGKFPLEKGLFIWGRVGCGKTTLIRVVGLFAHIFAKRNAYRIEHTHDASHKFQMKGAEALFEFEKGSVCFDELGSEPKTTSYFGTQVPVMPMHIEKRYRLFTSAGNRTHFTSNFDLKWLGDNYGVREADRVKEMCTVIQMQGSTRRK